ncbi:MAG: hypothetical protein PHQ98_03635 [Candidatus ainarchaeum sp.]|nr:hypothetical protein [Candidatus ainarchaeum sp.]
MPNKPKFNSVKPTLPKKPKLVNLKSGANTRITKQIIDFANKFAGVGPITQISQIKDLMHGVMSIQIKNLNAIESEQTYAKRSANKILIDNYIGTGRYGKDFINGGCVDHSLILCSALRAKNIPAIFVMRGNHAVTWFRLNKKWYEADVQKLINEIKSGDKIIDGYNSFGIRITPPIRELTKADIKKYNDRRRSANPTFAAGLDNLDKHVGIDEISKAKKYQKQ